MVLGIWVEKIFYSMVLTTPGLNKFFIQCLERTWCAEFNELLIQYFWGGIYAYGFVG